LIQPPAGAAGAVVGNKAVQSCRLLPVANCLMWCSCRACSWVNGVFAAFVHPQGNIAITVAVGDCEYSHSMISQAMS
jgi:hypothetical protein